MSITERIEGCLFGMAIGDGYGYPTEFLRIDEIIKKWPPNGPTEPEGNPILVTDDTQMAIAVANGIINSEKDDYSKEALEKNIRNEFVIWLNDEKNNRAPGMTCIRACEKLETGIAWSAATIKDSKGCGANMRVVPVGLMYELGIEEKQVGAIAQFQSVLTHAHPTALAASEITAITIAKIIQGVDALDLPDILIDYCEAQKNTYHVEYLENIWDRSPFRTPIEYITLGWEQVIEVLKKIKIGIQNNDKKIDPCLVTGEGWIAEEAFATALLCFLLFPNEPKEALKRAVVTTGDSDSIACLTGAFSGAYCGVQSIPKDWIDRIEYKTELENIISFFKTQK